MRLLRGSPPHPPHSARAKLRIYDSANGRHRGGATADRRFTKSTLVRERNLRLYAGTPLTLPSDLVVTLKCVLDTKPRQFSDRDRRLLEVMADEVMESIGARSTRVEALAGRA